MSENGWANVAIGAFGLIGVIVAGVLGYQGGSKAVSKDYVQIATTILANEKSSPELRKWSVDVLNKMSPVPFTSQQKQQLSAQGIFAVPVSIPTPTKIRLPDGADVKCPDVLAGNPKPTEEFWQKVLRAYVECRVRHNGTLDYVAAINKAIDEENAKAAKEKDKLGQMLGADRLREAQGQAK